MNKQIFVEKKQARKNRGDKVIIFTERFTVNDLITESHSIRTFSAEIFINLSNGTFVNQKNPQQIRDAATINNICKTVMNSEHRLIAKRIKSVEQSIADMSKGVSNFKAADSELRRVIIRYNK